MKKFIEIFFFALLFISCQKPFDAAAIPKINGYWEIEKVVFPDGTEKKYTINEMYDYFEIKGNTGFRKKVIPQLDGSFLVNDAFEKVTIKKEKDHYFICYTTDFSKWKEEVKSISDDKMVLINSSKNEYQYKKAAPIHILDNGKTTK